jgi:CheY-like chemotaxis protein
VTGTERPIVLVVEDDAALRGLLVDVLHHEGYTVLQAERGPQGLRLAQEHEPSLILTDQTLPGMSGLELLEELRSGEGTRHIPVVLISGFSVQIPGGQPHPDRILAKPFDLDALLTDVEYLTRLGRDRQPAER